jgi:hypothetical protein
MSPIGHFAVAFAAKPATPKVNIFVLLLCTLILDFLFFLFALVGLEGITKEIYWSHSLFMSVVWSVAFGLLGLLIYRDHRAGLVVGLLVFSHWFLDFVSHPMGFGHPQPPDLPLLFHGSRKVGLGLYNHISVWEALLIETAMLIPAVAIYVVYILRHRRNRAAAGGG